MTHIYTGCTYDRIVVRQPFTIASERELSNEEIIGITNGKRSAAWAAALEATHGFTIDWGLYKQADEDHEVIEVCLEAGEDQDYEDTIIWQQEAGDANDQ